MHARTWERAGPAAPAAVLVHGMVVSSAYLVPLAERLARELRVYAPDLPGYGRSPKPARLLRTPELADALADWLEAAGLGPVPLLGNSFGCQILAELGARHPERVERLVLVSPTCDPEARTALRLIGRFLREAPKELTMAPVLARDYVRAGLRRALFTFREVLSHRIEDVLPRVEAPILVVRGGRDPIVPQRWAEEVARLAPRGTLVTAAGLSHASNWTHPDELAAVVADFLRGRGPTEEGQPP